MQPFFNMEPIYGNHLGIVINKADPEGRKRVQVFIPYLSCTLYKNWNDSLKDITIKSPNDLTSDIVTKLQTILPWAEASMPLFGGSTGGTVNTATRKTSVNNNASTLAVNPSFGPPIAYSSAASGALQTSTADGTSPGASQTPPDSFVENGVTRLPDGTVYVNYNGNSSSTAVSINTDGPSNPVPGGVKTVATGGYDSLNVVGIVVSDPNLIGKTWTANGADGNPLVDPSTGQVITLIGQDTNASHGAGNTNADSSNPIELTPPAIEAMNRAGLNISYSNNYQSVNGSGSFSLTPSQDTAQTIAQNNSGNNSDTQIVKNNDHVNGSAARTPNSLITASGSPNGAFSVPNEGAKVWVFFYGGDIQKPIYFGAAVEPTT